jgi:hypothetical protein
MSVPKSSEPRRNRKRSDRDQVPLSFLPLRNPRARFAYLSALVGLVPGLGLLAGPFAMVYGWLGLRAGRTESVAGNGLGHAVVSMVLGSMEMVANAVGLPLLARGLGWL